MPAQGFPSGSPLKASVSCGVWECVCEGLESSLPDLWLLSALSGLLEAFLIGEAGLALLAISFRKGNY